MQLSLILAEKIFVFFLMMLCGFVLVRLKVLRGSDSKILSILNTYVLIPSMILKSFQIDRTPERMQDLILLAAIAVAIHVLFIVVSALLRRPLRLSGAEAASLVYTNSGSLVMPLVMAVLGEEFAFGASAFATVQIFFIWTHGLMTICGQRRFDAKRLLCNVSFVTIIVSVALFLLRIPLPRLVYDAADGLSAAMAPVCMLVIGMLIGDSKLKEVFSSPRAYFIAALRLIAYPLLLIGLFKLTGVMRLASTPTLLMISLLAGAAPAANTIINIAQVCNVETDMAVRINIVTTVLCILSMPLMLQAYQWVLM